MPVKSNKGRFLRNVYLTVTDFNGTVYGTYDVGLLFGRVSADARLRQTLLPGAYVATFSGKLDRVGACGTLKRSKFLNFK